jgi:hypothetical protein
MSNDATGRLASRYSRLLLAYPRRYRCDRGDEMLDTLMAGTPAGRRRPTVRQTVNLLASGMRCRLGRPRSRTIVVIAVLAAILTGYLGMAAATRLAWQASRDLPSSAEVAALQNAVIPGRTLVSTRRHDATFFYESVANGASSSLPLLVGSDFGDYSKGRVSSYFGPAAADKDFGAFARTTAQRLRAAGWSDVVVGQQILAARKDGLLVQFVMFPDGLTSTDSAGRQVLTPVRLEITRSAPGWIVPSMIIGAMLGALTGWLLVGWISRRTAGRSLVRQFGALLFGIAAFVGFCPSLAMSCAAFFPALAIHGALSPSEPWDLDGLSTWVWYAFTVSKLRIPALLGLLATLIAAAIAALPGRARPEPTVLTS